MAPRIAEIRSLSLLFFSLGFALFQSINKTNVLHIQERNHPKTDKNQVLQHEPKKVGPISSLIIAPLELAVAPQTYACGLYVFLWSIILLVHYCKLILSENLLHEVKSCSFFFLFGIELHTRRLSIIKNNNNYLV